MLWRYYYRIIKACNEIFDTVGGDESVPANEDNQNYYAQAKALRAHSYFNLVNLYAKPYDIDKMLRPYLFTVLKPQQRH